MQKEILSYYQKYKLYIFSTIVAFSAIILMVFVIYPQTSKLFVNQKIASDIVKKVDFLQSKVQALESYDENDLKTKVDAATFSYPVDKDLGVIVGLLQEITTISGFSITSLTLGGGSVENAGVQSYSIKLEMVGSEDSLPDLLKNMESSSRLLRISSIETTISKDKILNLSLNVEALYSGVPENFGSVDSSLPEITADEQDLLTKLARVVPVSSQTFTSTSRGRSNPFE